MYEHPCTKTFAFALRHIYLWYCPIASSTSSATTIQIELCHIRKTYTNCRYHSSCQLRSEHTPRRDLCVVTKFEILREKYGCQQTPTSISLEHIHRNCITGYYIPANQLRDDIQLDRWARDRINEAHWYKKQYRNSWCKQKKLISVQPWKGRLPRSESQVRICVEPRSQERRQSHREVQTTTEEFQGKPSWDDCGRLCYIYHDGSCWKALWCPTKLADNKTSYSEQRTPCSKRRKSRILLHSYR